MNFERLVSLISIPDEGKFTLENEIYFIFQDNPKSIRYEKALPALCAMLFFFAAGFFVRLKIQFVCWATAFMLALFYIVNDRCFFYYKRAERQGGFSRYKKMMCYINKMVNIKRIYESQMPLCYYILKARKLIETKDIDAADRLVEIALRENPNDMLCTYIKGVCMYCKGYDNNAVLCWSEMLNMKQNKTLREQIIVLIHDIQEEKAW
jgi:tetratricopeptide (TPR) repeat protein